MKRMLLVWATALMVGLVASPVVAQVNLPPSLCLFGCPGGGDPRFDLVDRYLYILLSNDDTKLADWVAYVVTRETIADSEAGLDRDWSADPALEDEETLEEADYAGAHAQYGYAMGHMASLKSLGAAAEWETLNYLSNVMPQMASLNGGAWKALENAERRLANARSVREVFAVAGPLYERPMPALPRADEPHAVPSGFWKVLAIQRGDEVFVVAFVMDQTRPPGTGFCQGAEVPLEELELRTGYDLFPTFEGEFQPLLPLMNCPR